MPKARAAMVSIVWYRPESPGSPDWRVVPAPGRAVAVQGVDEATHKGHDDQRDQDGAHDLAQPVGELLRPQGNEQRQGEEDGAVGELEKPRRRVRPQEGAAPPSQRRCWPSWEWRGTGRWPDRPQW